MLSPYPHCGRREHSCQGGLETRALETTHFFPSPVKPGSGTEAVFYVWFVPNKIKQRMRHKSLSTVTFSASLPERWPWNQRSVVGSENRENWHQLIISFDFIDAISICMLGRNFKQIRDVQFWRCFHCSCTLRHVDTSSQFSKCFQLSQVERNVIRPRCHFKPHKLWHNMDEKWVQQNCTVEHCPVIARCTVPLLPH